MRRVVVDAQTLEKFHGFGLPLEICDESGKVVKTRLMPYCDPKDLEQLEPKISQEEIERRIKCDKWYTTEQVLARLKSLENW